MALYDVYLIIAIILLLCGFGVFARSQVSRWIGVVAAAAVCISAIWWLPYYPLWSLTYVLLGALVIYALIAHKAREVETPANDSAMSA
jgi:membrane protein implicated in regulation of membrane protease activity